MTRLNACGLGALALSFSVCAMADVNVPIDPVRDCLNTSTMTGSKTTFELPAGRYLAWLVDDAMFCRSFDVERNCHIDTVIISAVNDLPGASAARWGQAIRKKPTNVVIPGSSRLEVTAFVVDSRCADNVGTALLNFHPD